ncbi:hypothetical protein KKE06_01410 [Candidatus Micrarchaeota archaeon]|nr:hypothetical protein [Candidatus Micrarchaeota archaeon]MBU1930415.1 hypothetical protein [Candidatus Micrarchaeota archaeon]
MTEKQVVKRKGQEEPFEDRKLYASVYWAARSGHVSEKEAEKLAETISTNAQKWLKSKSKVTAEELFDFVIRELESLNRQAAFTYRTHREA